MQSFRKKYGQWALVTGASSGLGAEFARQLAENGMDVVLVARRKKLLDGLARELGSKYNVKTLVVPADLEKDGSAERIAQKVGRREIALLVNNAGFGDYGTFAESDAAKQEEMVELNCVAVVSLTRRFIPQMVARKRGAVIFLSSVAGFQPVPFMSTYSATKAFDLAFGESLWYELRPHCIDVLVICPGGTRTGFQKAAGYYERPGRTEPSEVVRVGLRKLGRQPTFVFGLRNKITSYLARIFPRRLVIEASGRTMKQIAGKRP